METQSLLRDFAIIMAAGAFALVLFKWLKQPPVLGYIITGALIGPYMLPGITVSDAGSIGRIADLGLIVLLFTLGIEFGWQRVRQVGIRVIVIGVVEVGFMLGLGYLVGRQLGWSPIESFFLGAVLTETSTAVLFRYLRDWGQLNTARAQLVVGISVVEDLLAVILLSILTGVALTGGSSPVQIGSLGLKLALFGAAALVFGTLFVPRMLKFVQRFHSGETLLLLSLGLCFGLALVADELGVSAAAGAFLIGTVVGDTKHAEAIGRITSPVRDMFAALFFVSIGMLINFRLFDDALVPTLIVASVFIVGKIMAGTLGAFLTGHTGRQSVEVGTALPQMGEFSLAMVKVGADHGLLGAAFYPVVTMTTMISTFLFPFVMKSTGLIVWVFDHISPPFVKRLGGAATVWLTGLRVTMTVHGDQAALVRGAWRMVTVNGVVIAILLAVGGVASHYMGVLAGRLGWNEDLTGLLSGAVVITLCVPSGLAVWKGLSDLARAFTRQYMERKLSPIGLERRIKAALTAEQVLLGLLIALAVFFSLPSLRGVLSMGAEDAPVRLVVLAGTVLITARLAARIHRAVETTFRRTILGE